MSARPPVLVTRLLERTLPTRIREEFVGDLQESFRARLAEGRSPFATRLWYLGEALAAPLTLNSHDAPDLMPAPRAADGPMTNLLIDLRFAFRMLARQPGFTAVVAITLALGIGATTAIFSAVYPILFAPLPYPDADHIAMVWENTSDGGHSNVGYATFTDIAERSRTIASAAAVGDWSTILTTTTEPELLLGSRVSRDYFRTLGVSPALGRDVTAEDDIRGGERVVILGHALWRSRFGGDSTIVGRAITLDGTPFTVVGVMPAGFVDLIDPRAQLWTTLRYNATLSWACRSCRHLRMVARTKPGVTIAQANRELDMLYQRMRADHPRDYAASGFYVPALRDQLSEGVRPALLAVLGAVALVLLIACANVTNLLLARAAQREGEFAVRTALGAGNRRLVRQLLTESLLLAGVGGALGVAVAVLGVDAIVALGPPNLPRVQAIAVNRPVLLFALAITTLVGFVFGIVPAIHAARGDLHRNLQQSSRRATGGRRVTRSALVISEMALALVLLVGSGLLLRSMDRLFAISPGFDPERVLTLQVQTGGPHFANDTVTRAYFDLVLAAVRAVPGVERAGITSQLPLSGDFDGYGIHLKDEPNANPELDPSAFRYAVSEGYLETMRIPIRRGRTILASDRREQPAVAIVGESFARRKWPGADPIGKQFRVGDTETGPWWTVVGVAGDVRHTSLGAELPNDLYVPEAQWKWADGAMSFVVRTKGDPAALAPALRRAIWSVDKDQPIVRVTTMPQLVRATEAQRRFILVLFEAFALVALALAAAGIYGVISGAVVERRREVGIRAALGASRSDILSMVVRQGLSMAATGVAIGLVGALGLSRFIAGMLYGVKSFDLATYGAVAGILVVVAAAACWIPAWRAARVDPAVVLRAD
jgi:putative ABC transport system permease protein